MAPSTLKMSVKKFDANSVHNNGCSSTRGVVQGTWVFNTIMLLIISATLYNDAILSPSMPMISPSFSLYTPGRGEPDSSYYQITSYAMILLTVSELPNNINYSAIPSSLFPPETFTVCQETPDGHAGSVPVAALSASVDADTEILLTTSVVISNQTNPEDTRNWSFSVRWVYISAMISCGVFQLISLVSSIGMSDTYESLEGWTRSVNYFCLSFLNIFGVLVIICLWGTPVIQTLLICGFAMGGSVLILECMVSLHKDYKQLTAHLNHVEKTSPLSVLGLHNSPLAISTRRLFYCALAAYLLVNGVVFSMLVARSYNWFFTNPLSDWEPLYSPGLNSFSITLVWIFVGGTALSVFLLFSALMLDFELGRHNRKPRTFMLMTVEELQMLLLTLSNVIENLTLLMIGITAYFATHNTTEMVCET